MIQNLLSMNGYGLFVWSSFLITFLACTFVYYKTNKTLKNISRYSFSTNVSGQACVAVISVPSLFTFPLLQTWPVFDHLPFL